MRWRASALLLSLLVASRLSAQVITPQPVPTPPPVLSPADGSFVSPVIPSSSWVTAAPPAQASGTQGFSNFIGFMSNPLQNIDPRSLTQVWPIFQSTWTTQLGPIPSADFQVYGAGLNLALTERLSIGMNQGGFAAIHTDPANPRRRAGERIAARRDLGDDSRTGFLNLGGFAQYTLIANAESQTLFTVGTRFEVPSGSTEVFNGKGPAYLSPYVTAGQGLGNFHLLATAGYEFPLRTGSGLTRTYYLNGHLDYQLCDWVYPLVEVNWLRTDTDVDVNLPLRRGAVSLGNFAAAGELVTLSVGVNLVLIRDRLEVGGCWSTPIYARRDFDFNSLLLKMILRF